MYSFSIDSAGVWNVNNFAMLNHSNNVNYLAKGNESVENTTRSDMIMERLQASFRKDWLEVALDGMFNYNHSKNLLQSMNNLDTWTFSYGGSINIYAPWGTSFSTDLHNQSRRGYSDSSMNTNELIWNAQVSQSFLRGNALTLMLQFYDILKNRSNLSSSVSADMRSETRYNTINSYVMLHAVYRFNLFGGRHKEGQGGSADLAARWPWRPGNGAWWRTRQTRRFRRWSSWRLRRTHDDRLTSKKLLTENTKHFNIHLDKKKAGFTLLSLAWIVNPACFFANWEMFLTPNSLDS